MSTKVFAASARGATSVLAAAAAIALAACAPRPQGVVLEPGVQRGGADVDLESGTVSFEREGVVASAQGALLPSPRGGSLHPTFWVTIRNNRDDRIAVTPTDARLVDAFGAQYAPLPMSVDRGGREVRYALVDPEIRTYVSLHFGWPYYPVYPYPGWFAPPRYPRLRYWRHDPFWTFGVGPVWIMEVEPRPPLVRREAPAPERREFVYRDARLTYVVVFPEIDRASRNLRLIVPGVGARGAEGTEQVLEFELVFEQIVDAVR
jgi:hypothetical protein